MAWKLEVAVIPVSDVDRAKDPDGNNWAVREKPEDA
jgi:hypothetical protein